jgi:hypothetical protein
MQTQGSIGRHQTQGSIGRHRPASLRGRRDFLAQLTAGWGTLALPWSIGEPAVAQTTAPAADRTANPVQEENLKPGATDWQLTRVRADRAGFRSPWIEGYCSKQSVQAGETIEILVSTDPPRRFGIELFRMGYYGGRGARLVETLGPFDGKPQPVPRPGPRNLHECRWVPVARLTIPGDWLSGVYLGRLTTIVDGDAEPYWQSYVVFIVRDQRPAEILFQCSDNTWQAYNRWPNNYSLYTHPRGGQGPWADVSFDRPYGREAQHQAVVNDPLTFGSGEFLPLEFPLAYWLEQHGYDVTYCSNSDLLTPDRGLRCQVFLSGNAICWVTPYRASSDGRPRRIIFRGGPYGGETVHARNRQKAHGPFPEHGPDEGLLLGARNIEPVNGGGDWTVVKPEHWMFEGTGIKQGDRIPGLIGWEYHGDPPQLPGLEIVAAGTAWVSGQTPQKWTATIYPGPKGNFVFNAATIFWAQGLSSPPGHTLPWSHWSRPHGPDERVQKITHNLLRRALGRGT